MPKFSTYQGPSFLDQGFLDMTPGSPDVSTLDVVNSALRLENWIVGLGPLLGRRSATQGIQQLDPNFNVFEYIRNTPYENYAHAFANEGVRSAAHAEIVKQKIDDELRDRRILAESGMLGFVSQIGAGVVDPLNVVPFARIAGLEKLPRAIKTAEGIVTPSRFQILSNRVRFGASDAALGATVSELILQSQQQFRTTEESFSAIAASSIFGGLLGGIEGVFTRIPRAKDFPNTPYNSSPYIVRHEAAMRPESAMFLNGEELGTKFREGAEAATQTTFEPNDFSAVGMARRLEEQGFVSRPFSPEELQSIDNYVLAYRMAGEEGRRFFDTIFTEQAKLEVRKRVDQEAGAPVVVDGSLTPVEKTVLDDFRPVYQNLEAGTKAQIDTVLPPQYKSHLEAVERSVQQIQPPKSRVPDIPESAGEQLSVIQDFVRAMKQQGFDSELVDTEINRLIDEYPDLQSVREQIVTPPKQEKTELNQKLRNIKTMLDDTQKEINRLKEEIDHANYFIGIGGTEDFLKRERKRKSRDRKRLQNLNRRKDYLNELIEGTNELRNTQIPDNLQNLKNRFKESNYLDLDPDIAVLEFWDSYIKTDPKETIEQVFLNGLTDDIKADLRIQFMMDDENAMMVNVNFGDPEVNSNGFSRTFFARDDGKLIADHNTFQLSQSDQGKGIGKAFYRSWFDFYKKIGVSEMQMYANIDVGGYAWAKYGFIPTENSWVNFRKRLEKIMDEGIREEINKQLPKNRADELDELFHQWLSVNDNPRDIWKISDLKDQITINGKTQSIGKHLLLGRSWEAKLDIINDKDAVERFENYTKGE